MHKCIILLAAVLVMALFSSGCSSQREQASADSAASIWEAATAIEQGAPSEGPLRSIKLQAWAIIQANKRQYAPADAEHKEVK